MTKYANRADLLIAAGESIKMQEKAGIDPVFIIDGSKQKMIEYNYNSHNSSDYEFPLAVVEGKPVWNDSILYSENGTVYDMRKLYVSRDVFEKLSWNPPKPRTVMVELLREDAEYFSKSKSDYDVWVRLQSVCRKALEESK